MRTAIACLLLLASSLFAEVTVRTEQLNPAGPAWKFKNIPGPSKSDVAQNAQVTLLGNQWEARGGGGAALVNGRLPADSLDLTEEAWLSNNNTNDGSIVLDLGKTQPVVAINTYSWHEHTDQGARAPQVYTLFVSTDGQTWRKIADVDTRPNKTGEKWNGQHGVSVTGDLGELRYLKFEIKRTRSPLQRDVKMTGTLFSEIDVHTAATLAQAGDARVVRPPEVEQVVVVFKTHFDIGYTDMASNIVTKYRTTMIDQALAVADQNRDLPPAQQFAWTIPGWPMHKILDDWPGQTPQRKQRILDAFKAGRFVVHALPFTTHTELLEPEDLVRGLGYSSQLTCAVGLPLPRDAKMTDVPCHSWILPTLLRHAGIEFLHLGCNSGSSSPQVPPLFWWEGPDGSRLLTMYSAGGYGTGLVPPANWPYKTWLALIHTGDNHGPPRPDEVKKLLDDAAKKLPGVTVRIGRLSDFADSILAEKPDLPVVRADMPDTWIHGPMCDPQGAKLARTIRPSIAAAETLGTLLGAWGVPQPDSRAVIAKAYEQSLLYGEHTWGGALAWLTPHGKPPHFSYGDIWKAERAAGRFQRIEGSWAEHTAYIETARDHIAPLLAHELGALAHSVNVTGPRVVVFNPLPWKRDGVVTAAQRTFIARDVPALGYRAYRLDEITPARETRENRWFKIALDERGAIRSLMDKRTGRELVEPGFGRYLYERFDADQTTGFVNAYGKLKAWWVINEFGKPNLPPASGAPYRTTWPTNVTTRVTLHDDAPFVDLELTIHDKPADPWPEAGWLALPFKVDQPQFRLGRLGSVIDPSKDVSTGANRHLFGLNTGLAIFDASGRGVGLCALDNPLVSLDVPGCWKYSRDFVPRKPTVYVNLFNNQWTTNFRFWNEGTWTVRVRLWSFDRYDAASSLITPSLEARYPLQAGVFDGRAGHLPATQAGVSVSRPGVLVTALTPTLFRVWDQTGIAGEVEINGLKAATATPVNLRGEKTGEPIRVRDGKVVFRLGAFAPASFSLE
jgi:hypothetical protein